MRSRFVRISAFYFFYFAVLGVYLPYWPLYLKDAGYAPRQIGELMALVLAAKIMAPYLWAWLGDHTRRRLSIIRAATFLACASFALTFAGGGYYWLAFALFLFSFFWNASLPQLEVVTIDSLKYRAHNYSRVRLWGSIGFIALSVVAAPLIAAFGSRLTPWLIVSVLVALWLASVGLPDGRVRSPPAAGRGLLSAFDRRIAALLAICFLMQLTHGPYYTFFTIFMEEHGYSRALIGQLWAVGVAAEVAVLWFVGRLLPSTGAVSLLLLAIVATALRWLLLALFPEQVAVVVFSQSLHAITFGIYHAAMIHLVSRLFPAGLESRGQALYASLSFGVGGGLGTWLAGLLWEPLSGSGLFLASAAAALTPLLFLPLLVRKAPASEVRRFRESANPVKKSGDNAAP